YHVFINRNVKTKIFSCGHFYFIGCFSADKIVVAENRMITIAILILDIFILYIRIAFSKSFLLIVIM
ncbi:hypothetical protein, partial [uncultured Bacteroides sp.]|uniref:hypothetical protein n=1 Tax=uncultured Bacteroides sp. TaxID=162156 RepID=UPI00263330F9